MTGPCLCGDPECGRCFPRGRSRFSPGDLADLVTDFQIALTSPGPGPDLKALSPLDTAGLVELAIAAILAKLASGRQAVQATEQALDSELAQRIFDVVRDWDQDRDVAAAER